MSNGALDSGRCAGAGAAPPAAGAGAVASVDEVPCMPCASGTCNSSPLLPAHAAPCATAAFPFALVRIAASIEDDGAADALLLVAQPGGGGGAAYGGGVASGASANGRVGWLLTARGAWLNGR